MVDSCFGWYPSNSKAMYSGVRVYLAHNVEDQLRCIKVKMATILEQISIYVISGSIQSNPWTSWNFVIDIAINITRSYPGTFPSTLTTQLTVLVSRLPSSSFLGFCQLPEKKLFLRHRYLYRKDRKNGSKIENALNFCLSPRRANFVVFALCKKN